MQLNPELNESTIPSQYIEPRPIKVRQPSASIESLECRICLDSMQKGDLLQVCKCRGSSANVHEKCLVEWIKKSRKFRFRMGECYSMCEICKGHIYLQTISRCRWIKKDQVSSVLFNQHRCCTIMAILSILCNFVAIVIISFLTTISQVRITSKIFLIAYCVVVGLMLLTFLVYTVKCMIIRDIAELKLAQRKQQEEKMPVKKCKQIDEGGFILERGVTMDSLYPERSKNILIN